MKPRTFDPKRVISFRKPPHSPKNSVLLSAPVGHRSILAEVRAGVPPRQPQPPTNQPQSILKHQSTTKMTRGSTTREVDSLTWLTSVKIEDRRRGSSSNPGSEGNSADASRMSSRSRGTEEEKQRSLSRGRPGLNSGIEEPKESLQDEYADTSVTFCSRLKDLQNHSRRLYFGAEQS